MAVESLTKKFVALTFDFDALSLWLSSSMPGPPGAASRGEFGPIGVERILRLLADEEITATFFVPGHTALAYPDHVRMIRDGGHEIAHHGFVHERVSTLTPEREWEIFERGLEILEQVSGERPTGFRSPSGDFSESTAEFLEKLDFAYDSSLQGSDYTPYFMRIGDIGANDAPYVFGRESGVVELPWTWLLDDFPHFEFVRGGAGPSTIKPASQVYEIWSEEFDFFSQEIEVGCFNLVMHPQVIGRGSRIAMLQRLIQHMKNSGAVFSHLNAVARHLKPLIEPRSSIEDTRHTH